MKSLKLALFTAATCFAFAGAAQAGPLGSIVDKAKDVATDKAKDAAMDKGADMVTGAIGDVSTEDKISMGKKMLLEGKSAEDAAMEIAVDKAKDKAKGMASGAISDVAGDKSGLVDAALGTTGKVSAPGTEDKSLMDTALGMGKDAMMKETVMHKGSAPDVVEEAPAVAPPVNCPAGTTAQPNGTCMVTGDFEF